MSQIEMFAAETPAPAVEHGGYHPASKYMCQGRPVPVSYMDQGGMRVVQKPTLLWLLDDILDALYAGALLRRELDQKITTVVDPSTLGRHVHLLVDLGIAEMDYRFDEPRDAGGNDPAVIQLPKTGVS